MNNKFESYFIFLLLFFFSLAFVHAIFTLDETTTTFNNTENISGCGTAFNLLKSNNQMLGEERDNLKEEVNSLEAYRAGFFIVVALFVILIIMYFNVVRNLNNSRRSQNGRSKDKRKKKDR